MAKNKPVESKDRIGSRLLAERNTQAIPRKRGLRYRDVVTGRKLRSDLVAVKSCDAISTTAASAEAVLESTGPDIILGHT